MSGAHPLCGRRVYARWASGEIATTGVVLAVAHTANEEFGDLLLIQLHGTEGACIAVKLSDFIVPSQPVAILPGHEITWELGGNDALRRLLNPRPVPKPVP